MDDEPPNLLALRSVIGRWRPTPKRDRRVLETSAGFVSILFLGPRVAFVSSYDKLGWPARHLLWPLRPSRPSARRALRRLGLPPDESEALAETMVGDWPHTLRSEARLVANAVAMLGFALVGFAVTIYAVVRRLAR